ncbi:hypothetical protein HSX11_00175 [Oxalobacteraceae bacterium]|nr:hypothetical protein [Oxalobacteraceae bacterium]
MFKSTPLWGLLVICASMQTAVAQSHTTPPANASLQRQEMAQGDPARWYREDSTAAAQLRTLQKEIGAALQEANIACKRMPANERGNCIKEARATYKQDMANASQIRAENHPAQ